MKTHSGFTLIELVVVMIILSVMAAIALPKFMDMSGEAHDAAANAVAAAVSSGSTLNYAAKAAGTAGAVTLDAADVCTVGLLGNFVSGVTLVGASPTTDKEFQVGGTGDCSGNAVTVTCTILAKGSSSTPADAVIACAR